MDCWGNGVLRRVSEALDRRGTQVSAPEADSVAGSVERGISPRGTSDFEKVKVFHGTSLEPGRKLGRGCGQECTLFGCKLNFPHERTWHPEVLLPRDSQMSLWGACPSLPGGWGDNDRYCGPSSCWIQT